MAVFELRFDPINIARTVCHCQEHMQWDQVSGLGAVQLGKFLGKKIDLAVPVGEQALDILASDAR